MITDINRALKGMRKLVLVDSKQIVMLRLSLLADRSRSIKLGVRMGKGVWSFKERRKCIVI